jgi:hypothetical protein
MSLTNNRLIAITVSVVVLQACATARPEPYAREAARRPEERGVIALHVDPTKEDRALADKLMQSNCGELPVKIVEEQEVQVGERTEASGSSNVVSFLGVPIDTGAKESKTSAVTTPLREWQIIYECER